MGVLYKLDFPNGKSYIGITSKSLDARICGHRKRALSPADSVRGRHPLYSAWRKYGEPRISALAVIEGYDLGASEIRAVRVYGTKYPGGYNMTDGGENNAGRIVSEEGRRKISARQKGRPGPNKGKARSPETIKKMSIALKGKTPHNKGKKASASAIENQRKSHLGLTHTEESKAKMSIASKARPITAETREKMRASRARTLLAKKIAGVPWYIPTEEHRRKLSESNKGKSRNAGKKHSEDTKAKISAGNMGRVCTPETRAKISAATKGHGLGKKQSPETIAKRNASRAITFAKNKAAKQAQKDSFK